MTISIITATYNSEKTVRDTLMSIAAQTYPRIEHIIIDGSSSDNTLSVVREFPHVSQLLCENDKGIYDAMNKGIALANGEVVGILNSDDMYASPQVIETVMQAFADPAVDAVYGNLQYVRFDDPARVTRNWISGPFSAKKFYYGWMPPHPAFFVRKKIYDRYGGFNLSLRSAADYEFMLRVLVKQQCRAVYIPHLIVKMRTGGMSNATLRNRMRANREDREAWRLNSLKPYFFTIPFKPVRKIFQYIFK